MQQMGASAAGQLGQLGHMSGNQSSLSAPQQCKQLIAGKGVLAEHSIAGSWAHDERASALPEVWAAKHTLGMQLNMSWAEWCLSIS